MLLLSKLQQIKQGIIDYSGKQFKPSSPVEYYEILVESTNPSYDDEIDAALTVLFGFGYFYGIHITLRYYLSFSDSKTGVRSEFGFYNDKTIYRFGNSLDEIPTDDRIKVRNSDR